MVTCKSGKVDLSMFMSIEMDHSCKCFSSFRNLEKLERPIYSVKGHKEIINAIDGVGGLGIGDGAPEIATASRDGQSLVNSIVRWSTTLRFV
jgi:hypothetical protein